LNRHCLAVVDGTRLRDRGRGWSFDDGFMLFRGDDAEAEEVFGFSGGDAEHQGDGEG